MKGKKMKIKYQGKFNGDTDSLILREHKKNAVKFKEFDNPKKLGLVMNIVGLIMAVPLFIILFLRGGKISLIGLLLSFVSLLPHEFLHAICFKEKAYIYTNLKNGMLFVVGPETMSKGRFIFMSLLPNIIFAFIPFTVFLFFPKLTVLGTFGAISLISGVGDYYNVFNALRQMPKGARTYLYGFNSYWYMPENDGDI